MSGSAADSPLLLLPFSLLDAAQSAGVQVSPTTVHGCSMAYMRAKFRVDSEHREAVMACARELHRCYYERTESLYGRLATVLAQECVPETITHPYDAIQYADGFIRNANINITRGLCDEISGTAAILFITVQRAYLSNDDESIDTMIRNTLSLHALLISDPELPAGSPEGVTERAIAAYQNGHARA